MAMGTALQKWQMTTRIDDAVALEKEQAAQWRKVCALMDTRDQRTCRACEKRTDANAIGLQRGHRHHIVYRSAGGPSESWNLVTLCHKCHDAEHVKRTLRVEGNADVALTMLKRDADMHEWFIHKQELAPFVYERD